jgi:hypothetical protein
MGKDKTKHAYPCQKQVEDGSLKDITQWNPVQESQQRFQRNFYQRALLSFFKDLRAKFEDLAEFTAHLILEVLHFRLSHLLRGEIKDLLRKKLENTHIIFA